MSQQNIVTVYFLDDFFNVKTTKTFEYSLPIFSLNLSIPKSITKIFLEFNDIIVLKDVIVQSGIGTIPYENANGMQFNNVNYFISKTPQISICVKDAKKIQIDMKIFRFSKKYLSLLTAIIEASKEIDKGEARYEKVLSEFNELNEYKENYLNVEPHYEELEQEFQKLSVYKEYQNKYLDTVKSNNMLKKQVEELELKYNTISNSRFWKITWPIRKIAGFIRKNKIAIIIWKVCKSLRNEGLKKTYIKIKNKLHFSKKNYNAQDSMITADEIEKQINVVFPKDLCVSIVLVLTDGVKCVDETIESVLSQTYKNFELFIVKCTSNIPESAEKYIRKKENLDKRIIYKDLRGKNKVEGLAYSLSNVHGDYILLLNQNDILSVNALFEVAKASCYKNADFIYCDEDKFDTNIKKAFDPFFKPDFSLDVLRTYNYISNFIAFDKALLSQIELSKLFCDAYDYDLTLRLIEKAKNIVHIPKILYHLRYEKLDDKKYILPKVYDFEEQKKIVEEHFNRINRKANVLRTNIDGICKIEYSLVDEPLVSIIILNRDKVAYLKKCIDSIISKTTYKNYEIVIVENGSEEDRTFEYYNVLKLNDNIKIVDYSVSPEFNYSSMNNYAVSDVAKGEVLLFLNNDTEVITANWIQEMLMYAQFEDVGVVGAKLYYPNGKIQHAGVGVGLMGVAAHYFLNAQKEDDGYFYRINSVQNLSAVTGACLMIRKEVFDKVNGFDESFAIAYNDIDLCLKVLSKSYNIVYTPYAELYHEESVTRGHPDESLEKSKIETEERRRFVDRWKSFCETGDPYYNVNLSSNSVDFKSFN